MVTGVGEQMKKKIVAVIVFVSIGLVIFLFTPDGRYYIFYNNG